MDNSFVNYKIEYLTLLLKSKASDNSLSNENLKAILKNKMILKKDRSDDQVKNMLRNLIDPSNNNAPNLIDLLGNLNNQPQVIEAEEIVEAEVDTD